MARVFISYAHADEAWKDRVVRQLGVLAEEGLQTWDDRRIAGGDDWLPEIEEAIATCDVALLLISAHFLTSAFIKRQEVPALLERRAQEGIRVIPVILSPCQWTKIARLKTLQARPKDGKALSGMLDHDGEQALSDLAGEIHDLTATTVGAGLPAMPVPSPPQALNREQARSYKGAPLPTRGGGAGGEGGAPRVDITHLPAGAPYFLGREPELAQLDAAWASEGKTAIVELIAPGGTGKTALAKRWVENLKLDGWRGARRVFAWSFYSQGTSDDRQASEDHFLAEAVKWFGVKIEPSANPADKGRALAEELARSRTLLVLDGLEPLQYPPGPLAGELRAPGLKTLLALAASADYPGLILLTSREWVKDLDEWVRSDTHPRGPVLRLDLGNLSETDGARLLHAEGAKRAGEAAITPEDEEIKAASQAVQGHALTLTLLGRYLTLAHDGDIRKRDQVDFQEADEETQGGHAFRVMRAYERWFESEGEKGARYLAAFRLLGFFDHPASRDNLRALRQAPAIAGLTRPLVTLKPERWKVILKHLEICGIATFHEETGILDAHPLVRQYLAKRLEEDMPDAWKEGHRRIYEQLKKDTPYRPDTLAGLQPLYQAVAHGCKAGVTEEALFQVYGDRILRGTGFDGFYSSRKLGAMGSNVGAVACFFIEPWRRLAPGLKESDQAWLLNHAAFHLRALGRLPEALEPMRVGAEMRVRQKLWSNAAAVFSNLSELELSLGRITEAVADAGRSVEYADLSGDTFCRMGAKTVLANAQHQLDELEAARQGFAEAEGMQMECQPDYPLLYSLRGFLYCDLLLGQVERVVARRSVASPGAGAEAEAGVDSRTRPEASSGQRECAEVGKRAAQTLAWAEGAATDQLSPALDHLTLARCALYVDLLQGLPPTEEARQQCDAAVSGLRTAGDQMYIPLGLLTRAWLRAASGDEPGARADLDEAFRIASRGGMKLHLADIALHRARLFRDPAQLAKARALIEECGYGRRIPELEDAERAAETWLAAS